MATEDLTTWTEVDSGSKLTVTSGKIAASTYYSTNDNIWVYLDLGTNNIDGFTIDFAYKLTGYHSDSGLYRHGVVGFVTALDGIYDASNADDIHIAIYNHNVFVARLGSGDPASESDSTSSFSFGTTYYCTCTRSTGSDTITFYVYTDSDRNNLHDSAEITLSSSTIKYRYIVLANAFHLSSGSSYISYEITDVSYECSSGSTIISSLMW